ncbi:MAG: site-specific integrase [Alphaproteobacteria bacterium]|nr:site-specific integrase [Alphaproteobacteria bacterium]
MPNRFSAAITNTAVAALQPGDVINDTKLKGFMARRQKDAVSYAVKMRVNGRQRFFTIGRHGQPWTPETARKRALAVLADSSIAEKPEPKPQAASFADVAETCLRVHGSRLKPTSRVDYDRFHRLYLLPAFSKIPISEISRSMVREAHARWSKTPRAANFALAVLSKIMTWAEDDERAYRPPGSNPCRGIDRFTENRRERFLTREELGRLGQALDKAGREGLVAPYAIAAIRLLILTGARLNEILTLRWEYIDFERGIIFLPDSKTGRKPIILNDAATGVLNALPRFEMNPYVIVGGRHGQHLVNLQKPWQTVRNLAELPNVRIHDLRHTFASVAVASGGSLPIIGRALGHSQPSTTQRYAHLTDDPVRQLTQVTGEALAAALSGYPKFP